MSERMSLFFMSVDKFIAEQKEPGSWDSAGRFTVDLQAAAFKMSRYQLPSESHLLLKLVQLASLLEAGRVEICPGLRESTVSFLSSVDVSPDVLMESLKDPLSVEEPFSSFASVLMSGLSIGLQEISWKASLAGAWRSLRVLAGGRVEKGGGPLAEGEVRHDFRLVHSSGWKFWEGARRRREALDLIAESTRFAAMDVQVDGQAPEPTPAAALNDHVRDFVGSQFNAATGVMHNTRGPVVASNLLFSISAESRPGVRVATPPLTAFRQKEGIIAWTPGGRSRVTLMGGGAKPDGTEVSTWMLQFVAGSRNLRLEEVSPNPSCQAVIAFNIHGPGNSEGVRVTVVRFGVTVLETTERPEGTGLEDLIGCSVLIADDCLETDLGGLSVVKNERYYEKLRGLVPLVERGHRYFQDGSRYVSISE